MACENALDRMDNAIRMFEIAIHDPQDNQGQELAIVLEYSAFSKRLILSNCSNKFDHDAEFIERAKTIKKRFEIIMLELSQPIPQIPQ